MTFQTWLEEALAEHGETWADVIAHTLTADVLASEEPGGSTSRLSMTPSIMKLSVFHAILL